MHKHLQQIVIQCYTSLNYFQPLPKKANNMKTLTINGNPRAVTSIKPSTKGARGWSAVVVDNSSSHELFTAWLESDDKSICRTSGNTYQKTI